MRSMLQTTHKNRAVHIHMRKITSPCLKLQLYKDLASIEQVQHIKALIHHL